MIFGGVRPLDGPVKLPAVLESLLHTMFRISMKAPWEVLEVSDFPRLHVSGPGTVLSFGRFNAMISSDERGNGYEPADSKSWTARSA